MASGVKVDKDAAETYKDLQERQMFKFLVLGFNEKLTSVELKHKGEKGSTFDDLKAALQPYDHAYYIFYDCEYTTTGGQIRSKLLFASFTSDDHAPAKEKMLITSTLGSVKTACTKFAKHTTINDVEDLNEENFINIVSDNRSK